MRLGIQAWLAFWVGTIFLGLQATPITYIAPEQLKAREYVITRPGFYILTDDAMYLKDATAITIAADHVTLDLNDKVLTTSSGTVGISLQGPRENITIKNGKIYGFSQHGIDVDAGSHHLTFETISVTGSHDISGRGTSGISLAGSHEHSMYHVAITKCSTHGFDRGLHAKNTHEVTIDQGSFTHNGIGICAEYADDWFIEGINASYNVGNARDVFTGGILSTACRGWHLQYSTFNFNKACGQGACFGALFQPASSFGEGESSAHTISDCEFSNNSSEHSFARGLDLMLANACHIKNCSFNKNFSTVAAARGLSISGAGHLIEECRADANWTSAAGYKASGILIETGSAITVAGCRCSANVSIASNALANGIGLGVIAGSQKCVIKNCSSIANASIGFQDNSTPGDNLWVDNVAWGHGQNDYVGC